VDKVLNNFFIDWGKLEKVIQRRIFIQDWLSAHTELAQVLCPLRNRLIFQ
jgi:hypothetical protein